MKMTQIRSILLQEEGSLLQFLRLSGGKEKVAKNLQRPTQDIFLLMSHRTWGP